MTGVDRLRELARAQEERSWSSVGKVRARMMMRIADQIEREHAEDCFRMGERAAEDAEAIAWVREHGGIAYVKDAWNVRSNLDRQLEKSQTKVERQQRHIEFVQGKCRERQGRICELSKKVEEMRLRLMPEGIEWPRYDTDESVMFGDFVADAFGTALDEPIVSVELFENGFTLHGDGVKAFYGYKDRVRRPAVPAADGEPLEVGQTVWDVDGYGPLVVRALPSKGEQLVVLDNGGTNFYRYPEELTHRRPGSWERVEEDARLKPSEYTDRYRVGRIGFESEDMRVDLVRRCKALAERGE